MSLYKTFATDADLERKGVVIDYGEFRVTIARAGGANRRYNKVLASKARPYRRAIQTETLPDDIAEKIQVEVFAETVILNWETLVDGKWKQGIEGRDGKLMSFTKENVIKICQELPDLFSDISDQALKATIFKVDLMEEEAKNL